MSEESAWWSPLVGGALPALVDYLQENAPADATGAFSFLSGHLIAACPNRLLLQSGILARAMLTEGLLSTDESISLARLAIGHDASFDLRFLTEICERPGRVWPEEVSEWEMCRALDVLRHTLRNFSRVRILLLRFLRVPHSQVRSRVASMTRDIRPNDIWFDCLIADEDPRVRSNVLEVLEDESKLSPARRALATRASTDPHHRVQTTALYILALFGSPEADQALRDLLVNPNTVWQRAAAWALGRLETKRLERRAAS